MKKSYPRKRGGKIGGLTVIYPKEYTSFKDAKYRCTVLTNKDWDNYGGRGILFKFDSFEQFINELGSCPKGQTLDRIDADGNYEPGNVRWATRVEQYHNKRRTNLSKYTDAELIQELHRRKVLVKKRD